MAVQIRADEISKIIRSQIQGFDRQLDVAETGIILSVGDSLLAGRLDRALIDEPSDIVPGDGFLYLG